MPFLAETSNGDRVNILDHEKPKAEISTEGLRCLGCGEGLFIRSPTERLDHFCHYPGDDEKCSRGESLKHLLGKNRIAQLIIERYPNAQIKLEREIGSRIADVLAIHAGGQRVAHELQLSNISQQNVAERSIDYLREGVSVQWWLGPKISDGVRGWALRNLGGFYKVELVYQEEELRPSDNGVPNVEPRHD